MRLLARCLVPVGVIAALATGCSSSAHEQRDSSRPDPRLEDCGHRINAQIEAGIIPGSDREYATDMCLRNK